MPYVKCPSCELVSYSAAAYATLECCPHCGVGLPQRRAVVSLAAYRRALGRDAISVPERAKISVADGR